ncbi:hypothetical protein B0H14DRAFT_3151376 [Mycena olivaceomarginata]|nr:hypothetical protein B0H14DRAFT_3151376 [Mycena olivaceomarginata]
MWVRIGTSPTFPQYPSPNSERSPEIRTAQAGVRSEIPGERRFCCLRPRGRRVPVEAWGAHRLRVVRAMPARGTVIAANAAGADDGKPPGGVINERGGIGLRMDGGSGEGMGRWGDSCSVCCAREMVPVLFAVRGRPRFRAVAGVGAEDRRGARGGDEGGVGDGECALHLLRAPAMLRVVLPVPDTSWLRAEDNQALDTVAAGKEVLGTRGVVHASALRACGSGRVVLAGDAFGTRGGDKSGAGDGKRPSHALRTQEAMKVVLGSTADAGVGRRRGTPASRAARVAGSAVGACVRAGVVSSPWGWQERWPPGQRAALLVAAHVVWSIDTVEKASGASEEAPLCRTDGGAAKDHCGCELTPLDFWELRTGCTPDEERVHAVRRGFSSTQNGCGAAWGTGWEEAPEISVQEDYKR